MSSDVIATERISSLMLLFAPLFSKDWQRVLELVMVQF